VVKSLIFGHVKLLKLAMTLDNDASNHESHGNDCQKQESSPIKKCEEDLADRDPAVQSPKNSMMPTNFSTNSSQSPTCSKETKGLLQQNNRSFSAGSVTAMGTRSPDSDRPSSSKDVYRPTFTSTKPAFSRKLQPMEFPSVNEPTRTLILDGEEGGKFKRILTQAGIYYILMENRGTGGVFGAKGIIRYQYRPLSWEIGGSELQNLMFNQFSDGDDNVSINGESINRRCSWSPSSPLKHVERGDDTEGDFGIEPSDKYQLPTGVCDVDTGESDSPDEEGAISLEDADTLLMKGDKIPKGCKGVAFYKNSPIGLAFMKGRMTAGRGASKVYYFVVGQPFQRLFLNLTFSWGKATEVKVSLGYGGPLLPIPPLSLTKQPSNFMKRKERKRYRILALDGGGVLGGSILVILEYIENELRRITRNPEARIVDYFDLIVGTSTGGIITATLLKGYGISYLRSKWKNWAQTIFGGTRNALGALLFNEGYDVEPTKKLLQDVLGHAPIASLRPDMPRCAITSTDVSHQPYQLYIHRNYDLSDKSINEGNERNDINVGNGAAYPGRVAKESSLLPLWLVAWIAGSAPTYIRGPTLTELQKMGVNVRKNDVVHLVDGAFLANNPSVVALKEGAQILGKSLNYFCRENLSCLVSIGTGVTYRKKTEMKDGNVSSLQILLNAPHLFLESGKVHKEVMHEILVDNGEDTYFRYNTPGLGEATIDNADEEQLKFVVDATKQYMEEEKIYDTRRLTRLLVASDV